MSPGGRRRQVNEYQRHHHDTVKKPQSEGQSCELEITFVVCDLWSPTPRTSQSDIRQASCEVADRQYTYVATGRLLKFAVDGNICCVQMCSIIQYK